MEAIMNLIDITAEFATEDACLAYLEAMRWPSGVACLKCGSLKVKRLNPTDKRGKTRRVYQCLERPCLHQFTATTGTIFHDTHLPLRTWFIAIALICDAKKGTSACQLQRHLPGSKKGQKMSYRTAWYLCHRIRKAMEEGPLPKFTGIVEADETYVGGKYDRRRKRGPWENPGAVGIMERGGKIVAKPIKTPSAMVLTGIVRDRVAPEAQMVVTDQLAAYKGLKKVYRHEVINHIREYVRGKVHTNSVENFWSLLKRGVMGSYHKVSIRHLPRYLAEFTYRFNRREEQEQLFAETTRNLLRGERLPYKTLTASQVSES
jgi:transposase-like protein